MSCAKRRSFFLHARITLGPHTQRRQGNASRQTATCTLKIKHRFLADDRPEEDSRRVGAPGVDYCGRGIAVTVAHSLFSPLLAAAAAAVVVVVVAAAARARARARAGRATESAPRARRTTSPRALTVLQVRRGCWRPQRQWPGPEPGPEAGRVGLLRARGAQLRLALTVLLQVRGAQAGRRVALTETTDPLLQGGTVASSTTALHERAGRMGTPAVHVCAAARASR